MVRQGLTTRGEYQMAFAHRLRVARVNAGYTQEEIAHLLRIKTNTYNRYEGGRGSKPPSMMPSYLLYDFCTACQISERWLLSGRGQGPETARPMRRSGAA